MIFGHDEAAHTLRWTLTNYKVQNVPSCALITKIGTKNPQLRLCFLRPVWLNRTVQAHSGGGGGSSIWRAPTLWVQKPPRQNWSKVGRGVGWCPKLPQLVSKPWRFQPLHEKFGELECYKQEETRPWRRPLDVTQGLLVNLLKELCDYAQRGCAVVTKVKSRYLKASFRWMRSLSCGWKETKKRLRLVM